MFKIVPPRFNIRPPTVLEMRIFLALLLILGFTALAVLLYSHYQSGAVAYSDDEIHALIMAFTYIMAALIPILFVSKLLKMFGLK